MKSYLLPILLCLGFLTGPKPIKSPYPDHQNRSYTYAGNKLVFSASLLALNPANILDSTEYVGWLDSTNNYGWKGGQVGVLDNLVATRLNGYNTLRFKLSRHQNKSPERTELSDHPRPSSTYTFANYPEPVRWAGDAIFIPEDYVVDNSTSGQLIVNQFLPSDPSKPQRPACGSLRIVNNRWKYRVEYDTEDVVDYATSPTYKRVEWDLGEIEVGVFTKWVTQVKFSWTTSGFVKLYKNGELVLNYSGPTTHKDPNGFIPWFKFGLYKPLWGNLADTDPSPTNTITIYHSDTRLGNSDATMEDVETLKSLANTREYVYQNVIADSVKIKTKLELPGTSGQYVRGDGTFARAGFEFAENKSDNLNLGTSSTLFPTQKAVKTYVDSRSFVKKGVLPEPAILDTIRSAGIFYASDGSNNTPELGYPAQSVGLLISYNSQTDANGVYYQEFITPSASKYYRYKSPSSAWTTWSMFGRDTLLVHNYRDETIRGNKSFTGQTSLKGMTNTGASALNGTLNVTGVATLAGATNLISGATTMGSSSASPLILARSGANQLTMGFQNGSAAAFLGITPTGELRVGPTNNILSTGSGIWHSGNELIGKSAFSGNGTQTEFLIAHNAVAIPRNVIVTPTSKAAGAPFYVDAIGGTNFRIVFLTAPPTGTNNIKFNWVVYK